MKRAFAVSCVGLLVACGDFSHVPPGALGQGDASDASDSSTNETTGDSSPGETSTDAGSDALPDSTADGADGDAGPLCTAGSFDCSGDTLRKCAVDGQSYADITACPSGTCSASLGRCNACTPRAYRCTGSALEQCDSEGATFGASASCSSTATCDATDGKCLACAPNSFVCLSDGTLQKCAADGSGLTTAATCPNQAACDATAGQCTACTGGSISCSAQQLMKCRVDGSGSDPMGSACPGGTICDATAGGRCDDCAPGAVDTNSTGCTPTKFVHSRTCGSNGKWGSYGTCDWPKGWTTMAASPSWEGTVNGNYGFWTGDHVLYYALSTGIGALYDPKTDTWRTNASFSYLRPDTGLAIWGDTQLFVFGGEDDSDNQLPAGLYDPVADQWTFPAAAPFGFAEQFTGAWSHGTGEFVVWGKDDSGTGVQGLAYSPSAKKWRTLKASPLGPRSNETMVPVGNALLVFGGAADSATYDPVADTWALAPSTPSGYVGVLDNRAAPAGSSAFLAFGESSSSGTLGVVSNGAIFDGVARTWSLIPALGPREYPAAWSDGTKLWVWGGYSSTSFPRTAVGTGAVFDPKAGTWAALPAGGPSAGGYGLGVWTGAVSVVVGGIDESNFKAPTAKVYKP